MGCLRRVSTDWIACIVLQVVRQLFTFDIDRSVNRNWLNGSILHELRCMSTRKSWQLTRLAWKWSSADFTHRLSNTRYRIPFTQYWKAAQSSYFMRRSLLTLVTVNDEVILKWSRSLQMKMQKKIQSRRKTLVKYLVYPNMRLQWTIWPPCLLLARESISHICLARYMLSPVRLSVCPSHGCIIQKRLRLGLWNFPYTVAPSL